MQATSKAGFVLIGLVIGIIAAQALPLFAYETGSASGRSMMHGMGAYHMKAMHGMMSMHGLMMDGTCPMADATQMHEACKAMLAGDTALAEECAALAQECAELTGSPEAWPEACPMLNGSGTAAP